MLARIACFRPKTDRGREIKARHRARAPDDPALALIAEEERLRVAGVKLQDQGFLAGEQSLEGDALVDRAGELYGRIEKTTPTTLAGIAAMIELANYQSDPLIRRALAALQRLSTES